MEERRDKVMFFAGGMRLATDVNDHTGRGGAYVYYGNDTRYLIAPKGIFPHHIKFSEAMLSADFCYSPLGTHGGDPGECENPVSVGMTPVSVGMTPVSVGPQ